MVYKVVKRFLDIAFSILLLIGLFPVLLVSSMLIKLESSGPIIFKQQRAGKDGKIFYIYKFRSMNKDNDALNFNEKDKITKIGKILRKYSIDELPQLFNVLKGDMSIIGPRPYLAEYTEYFTYEQRRRLNVLPGMIYPSVNILKHLTIEEKINLDVMYINNYSFKQDLKLILYCIFNYNKIFSFRKEATVGNKTNIYNELEELKKNKEKDTKKNIINKNLNNNILNNNNYINQQETTFYNSIDNFPKKEGPVLVKKLVYKNNNS